MAGVDLNIYRFDYDLTFAILLMNGDGTIYHRYGTRDETSAIGRLSMESLVRLLKETIEDHAAYQKSPHPPKAQPPRSIEEIPPMKRKMKKEKIECFHCHMVNEAERDLAQDEKRFSREQIWLWPLPEQAGLKLDRDDQARLVEVIQGSAADLAGLKSGDRLARLGNERICTQADVQWVFHNTTFEGGSIPVEFEREKSIQKSRLVLPPRWKETSPLAFSWRASMWGLRPSPGFGGNQLKGEELRILGLPPGSFAAKLTYIVDWGEHAADGRSAFQAGLRKSDILLAAGGKNDFVSELHFQSWFRFTQKPGTKIELEILRNGQRLKFNLPVLP